MLYICLHAKINNKITLCRRERGLFARFYNVIRLRCISYFSPKSSSPVSQKNKAIIAAAAVNLFLMENPFVYFCDGTDCKARDLGSTNIPLWFLLVWSIIFKARLIDTVVTPTDTLKIYFTFAVKSVLSLWLTIWYSIYSHRRVDENITFDGIRRKNWIYKKVNETAKIPRKWMNKIIYAVYSW